MSTFREEVINVVLADLLRQRGTLTVPEQIRKAAVDAKLSLRLPDIVVADFWGIRVVIEGRTTGDSVETGLSDDARRRVEEGIAPICIAVLYPRDVREAPNTDELKNRLIHAVLQVRVFSEASTGDWTTVDVDGLSEVIRMSYEELVREDVISKVVEELDVGIESVSQGLLASAVNPERLRVILGIRELKTVSEDEQ